ncbi:GGDEF domain-containing protein [Actinotalea sp. C106]|uniref:GGDEF domain-containing protein n=1 Tax=Actinotalea sp. C106 TaxID=2908644 RepID=UPI0020291E2B|nr:GGDEF domain-containing protein [Actinotalea sp. C106]
MERGRNPGPGPVSVVGPSDPRLDAIHQENLTDLLRKVLVIGLLLGLPTIVAVIVVAGPTDPLVGRVYPPLVVYLAVYAWVLLRRPSHAVAFSRVTLTLIQAVWVVVMVYRLRSAQDAAAGWASLFPTTFMGLIIFVLVGYLVYDTRRALVNAAGVVAVVTVAGAVALLSVAGGDAYLVDLLRYAVYLCFVALLLHVLARAKARLGLALAVAQQATAEAHEMRDMAYLDALTGVANRRRLVEELTFQAQHVSPEHPVAVLYFDLDHFKQVNDEHGHAVGDHVLTTVAEVASRVVRQGDLVARVGGEEFVIVAPGTSHERAVQVAERLRAVLPDEVGLAVGTRITASFGVVALHPAEPAVAVLTRVDALMYHAKVGGRDRVTTSPV